MTRLPHVQRVERARARYQRRRELAALMAANGWKWSIGICAWTPIRKEMKKGADENMRKQLTRVQLMENWEANWQRERRLKEERMREQTETEGADGMSDELYPLGHEADETMYSAGELRQLLNDERAGSYARGFAAGLLKAAEICDYYECPDTGGVIRALAAPKETT